MSPLKIDERPSAALAMNDHRPKRETTSIEEATISDLWEMVAILEVPERKGLCTKQDLYNIITEFRRKNPRARISEMACSEPYLLTETENKLLFLARRVRFQMGETRTVYFDITDFYKKNEDLLRPHVLVN